MIYGIGIDIVDLKRIEHICQNNNLKQKFIDRILTEKEQKNTPKNIINYLAKSFAAKEAFSKALGTGIGGQLGFLDLSVLRNDKGKPYFSYSTKMTDFINKKLKAHLSLSDENKQCFALVIIERSIKNL